MENFKKRHVIVVDMCCMFKRNGESLDHFILLLLHFFFSFIPFGLYWVMPRRVIDLFAYW